MNWLRSPAWRMARPIPLLCSVLVSNSVWACAAQAAIPQPSLYFERNGGQTDARVQFLARTEGATVFLTGTEAILSGPNLRFHTRAVGANPKARVTGQERQSGAIRYYRHRQLTQTEAFHQVRYESI